MSGSDPDREFQFLDVEKLYEQELEPVNMTAKQALEEALLDIIQLSEHEGVKTDVVDNVLRKVVDDRAARTRAKFTIHLGDKGSEPLDRDDE